jgi:hypothetical protein
VIHCHRTPGALAVLEHWQRICRWQVRFERLCIGGKAPDSIDVLDHAIVVLIACFSMRDWLLNAWAGDKSEVEDLFSASWELQVCRDIANGAKHLDLTRPSVDAHHEIGRSLNPYPRPDEPKVELVLHAGGKRAGLADFCHSCVAEIRRWLEARGLTTEDGYATDAGLGPR